MPTYRVTLVRSFAVTVQAENTAMAREMSELNIGYNDLSQLKDRRRLNFSFEDIEMMQNDAIEAEEMGEDNG